MARISLKIELGGFSVTVNEARFPELEVKSPPTIDGKQDGSTVAVTVAVVVDMDTVVIVSVVPVDGQVGLDTTVVVTVEATAVMVVVAVQLR